MNCRLPFSFPYSVIMLEPWKNLAWIWMAGLFIHCQEEYRAWSLSLAAEHSVTLVRVHLSFFSVPGYPLWYSLPVPLHITFNLSCQPPKDFELKCYFSSAANSLQKKQIRTRREIRLALQANYIKSQFGCSQNSIDRSTEGINRFII